MGGGDLGGLVAARQGTGGGNHLKSSQATALKNFPQFHILSCQDLEDSQIPVRLFFEIYQPCLPFIKAKSTDTYLVPDPQRP